MKNTLRIPGILNRAHSAKVPLLIIALAAVIGFTMTACPTDIDDKKGNGGKTGDDGKDQDGSPSPYLGDNLTLSGQVYTEKWIETSISYEKFTDNLTLTSSEGSGKITNGQLSYTIGTPSALTAFDLTDEENMFGSWDDLNADNAEVKGFILSNLAASDNSGSVSRENAARTESETSISHTYESVVYVYVEGDITITGKGKSRSDTENDDGITNEDTYTYEDLSLALKKGWNAVYYKEARSGTKAESTITSTITITMSLNNPNLKWILNTDV